MPISHRTTRFTAGLSLVMGLATGLALLPITQASADVPATQAWTDPIGDVSSSTWGPPFDPALAPGVADLSRVEIATTTDLIYLRLDLADVYGNHRATNGQLWEQKFEVGVFDESQGIGVYGTLFLRPGLPRATDVSAFWAGSTPEQPARVDYACPGFLDATWSTTDDWVLFRLPRTCVDDRDTGPLVPEAAVAYSYSDVVTSPHTPRSGGRSSDVLWTTSADPA